MLSFPKPRLLCAALALLLGTSAHAEHYKVFLLGGQSNMQGNNALASQLPPNLQGPQDDLRLYSGTNSAATFDSLQPGAGNNFGPEVSFGRTIADGRPRDRFCLVKFAQGSTNLHSSWDPASGSVYAEFRRTVGYALDAITRGGHTYEIVGMCWTQGENDVQDFRTTAQYQADLNEFIADIRTRYGAGVRFFISRLSDNQTWRPASQVNEIRTAQDNVAAADPLSYLIDTDGFDMRADNLHFEETGYVDIGEAFGQSYLNSLPVDATAPAIQTLSPDNTASGVDPTADLTITFNEEITFGTGSIHLRQSGGNLVESFDVANPPAGLSLSGTTITINPSALLSPNTGHYLEIDTTAIDDFAGNSFGGFSGDGTWSFTTSAADTTPPAIASLSPAHSATGILFSSDLTVTFSENIRFGSGNITLRHGGGALVESYDVAGPSGNLTLSGKMLKINPTNDLDVSTTYYVEIDATAIVDHAGNSLPGFTGSGTWSFTTTAALISGSKITATASIHAGENSQPFMTIDGSGLSGGVHGTAAATKWNTPGSDIVNQWIQWDLGASYTLDSIHVWPYKDNFVSSMKSVDIYLSNAPIPGDPEGGGAGNWTKLGGASVDLPEAPNTNNTGFDLETATSTTLPSTEVRFIRFEINSKWLDTQGLRTGMAEIQFTAKPNGPDLAPPVAGSFSPTHTATGVNPATSLTISFNEDIAFGSGNVTLRQSAGALVDSFDVAAPGSALSLSGDTLTINPTADLADATTYYVEIDGTAIEDLAGNAFAGFSGSGTWSFTTIVPDTTPPILSTLSPTNGATGVSLGGNLSITISEDVAFGTGNIALRRSGGALVESFNVSLPSPGLTLSGDTVTINPTASLSLSTTYYIEIDATAIDDLADNSFGGFFGNGTWSFTTTNAVSATTPSAGSIAVQSNGFNPDPTGAVGRNANGLYEIRTLVAFSVANIVSNTSMGLADFATTPFDLTCTTVNAITLTSGQTYEVDYLGFYDNVAALNEAFFDSKYGTTATSTIDTGIEDSTAAGQEITATGFTLSDVTGTDANDYVVFRIRYNQTANSTMQQLNGFTLSSVISANDTFADWIGGYSGLGGLSAFDDDADGDGITNGIENYFGTHPGEFSQGIVAGAATGNTFTFTHPLNGSPASNLTAVYRWSKDLSDFHGDGEAHEGTTVSFSQSAPSEGIVTVTVTATVTGAAVDRLFVDVEVTLD